MKTELKNTEILRLLKHVVLAVEDTVKALDAGIFVDHENIYTLADDLQKWSGLAIDALYSAQKENRGHGADE